jgi:hypothetical protein
MAVPTVGVTVSTFAEKGFFVLLFLLLYILVVIDP